MMKDTALVSFLGVTAASAEVFRRSQLVGKADFKNLEAYVAGRRSSTGGSPWSSRSSSAGWRPGCGRLRADPGAVRVTGPAHEHGGRARMTGATSSSGSTGLRKSFGSSRSSAASTWRCTAGEVVVIFGRSGSGKSTVLRCVELHRGPHRGLDRGRRRSGWHGGHRTRRKREQIRQLRLHVGMVFQQFNLFPNMTVLDNVTCAPVLRRPRHRDADRSAGQGPARPGRPRRQGGRAPDPALRRPAAAGRDRPGAGHGARRDALRRADLGPRPRAHRRGAGRDEVARHRDAHDR